MNYVAKVLYLCDTLGLFFLNQHMPINKAVPLLGMV